MNPVTSETVDYFRLANNLPKSTNHCLFNECIGNVAHGCGVHRLHVKGVAGDKMQYKNLGKSGLKEQRSLPEMSSSLSTWR
jgi:hypothetical protein